MCETEVLFKTDFGIQILDSFSWVLTGLPKHPTLPTFAKHGGDRNILQ